MRNRYLVQRVRSGVMEGRVHSGTEDTHSASGQGDNDGDAEILLAMSGFERELEKDLEHLDSGLRIDEGQRDQLKEHIREVERYLQDTLMEMEKYFTEEMNTLKEKIAELEGKNAVLELKNTLLELKQEGSRISTGDVEKVSRLLDEVKYQENKLKNEVNALTEIAAEQDDEIYTLRKEIERLERISPDNHTSRVQPGNGSNVSDVKAPKSTRRPVWRARFGLFD
jgi:chromosome segregation ATPase